MNLELMNRFTSHLNAMSEHMDVKLAWKVFNGDNIYKLEKFLAEYPYEKLIEVLGIEDIKSLSIG